MPQRVQEEYRILEGDARTAAGERRKGCRVTSRFYWKLGKFTTILNVYLLIQNVLCMLYHHHIVAPRRLGGGGEER